MHNHSVQPCSPARMSKGSTLKTCLVKVLVKLVAVSQDELDPKCYMHKWGNTFSLCHQCCCAWAESSAQEKAGLFSPSYCQSSAQRHLRSVYSRGYVFKREDVINPYICQKINTASWSFWANCSSKSCQWGSHNSLCETLKADVQILV